MARAPGWTARLNRHFAGHARILGRPEEIVLRDVGELPVSGPLRAQARRLRPPFNEGHGILANRPAWSRRRVDVHYQRTEYRVVAALRRRGELPRVLSSSALLIAPRQRALVLHQRSSKNGHYKRLLHIVGGAVVPPESFELSMVREVREETRLRPRPGRWPVLMVDEPLTGYVMATYLGVETAARPHGSREGATVLLPFDELPGQLIRSKHWVPSGKLAILAWLALGAPGAPGARFAGRSPSDLFKVALEGSVRDYPDP
jgi:8-oxo-dGTP pyrophosphatase MutT (NUDIX family)